ncbi:MAG: DUF4249 family protein [Ignavibacteriales bacterium]|nr:MAG: DUF4249 family protein [Ignavibacteriales bacterium]
MKKLILYFLLMTSGFLMVSCEEDFSPKTAYKEKFILSCIVRGDTSLQMATLSHSYSVSGFDPYENQIDPFIGGADIRIWHDDNVYFMKDTLLVRSDTSRYSEPIKCYYIKDFLPGSNEEMEIRAVLPTGKTLVGFTKLPQSVTFTSESDAIIPPLDKDNFEFTWAGRNNTGWYLTRFSVYYKKNENGTDVFYRKEVPAGFIEENGRMIAKYPSPSRSTRVGFPISSLDSVFTWISQGDPNKSNYTITGGVLEVLIFDDNLSKYYSSINGFLDEFTIRVDESDYTNITGGFGIFGSYIKQQRGARITTEYIESFGYVPANP